MQGNLLPLSESVEANHKIKSFCRDRNTTACDLNVPAAAAFQNTYRLLFPNSSLEHSLLEFVVGLENHWPLFQITGLQH